MKNRRNKTWIVPVILLICMGIIIAGILFLTWLFRTPIDWGTEAGAVQPRQGLYEQTGNHAEEGPPQIYLDLERRSFVAAASLYHSYSEHGSFVLEDGKLIATTQSATLVFEVLDRNTLVLTDNGGFTLWLKEGDRYKWVNDPLEN